MSSRKIEDLNQIFQPMVRSLLTKGQEAIASSGWTLFITDGFRSFEEQTQLYNQGRITPGSIVTNAKAGQSAHNFGLAVDLAFQKAGVLSYSADLYAPIYKIARSLGFELGADWAGFVDKPHFEHPQWELIAKGNTPESEIMSKLLTFLGIPTEDEAITKLTEHLGSKNNLCQWGKQGDEGGFLGSARRELELTQNKLDNAIDDLALCEEKNGNEVSEEVKEYINIGSTKLKINGLIANGASYKVVE